MEVCNSLFYGVGSRFTAANATFKIGDGVGSTTSELFHRLDSEPFPRLANTYLTFEIGGGCPRASIAAPDARVPVRATRVA